jgi:hypothetical protein
MAVTYRISLNCKNETKELFLSYERYLKFFRGVSYLKIFSVFYDFSRNT